MSPPSPISGSKRRCGGQCVYPPGTPINRHFFLHSASSIRHILLITSLVCVPTSLMMFKHQIPALVMVLFSYCFFKSEILITPSEDAPRERRAEILSSFRNNSIQAILFLKCFQVPSLIFSCRFARILVKFVILHCFCCCCLCCKCFHITLHLLQIQSTLIIHGSSVPSGCLEHSVGKYWTFAPRLTEKCR